MRQLPLFLRGIHFPRLFILSLLFALPFFISRSAHSADHIIFVTWDGFRWQELFTGAEEALINKETGGVTEVDELRTKFWRDTPEARREALLPFVWHTLAEEGQIFGDPDRQAATQVTNGKKFSYPGYSEMFVGFPDERINSNNKVPNPNKNVLEFLNQKPRFQGKIAAFATWDVMDFILNQPRSGIHVQTGWKPIDEENLSSDQLAVNQLIDQLPRLWRGNTFDVITHASAKAHLLKHQPRVLYIGLGETDEWAHAKRYDLYLESAHRADRYLAELWQLIQSLPNYRNNTNLVLTADHGRGFAREWTNHAANVVGAEFMWIAVIGPDIPALGVRENIATTQSQIAATLARLVGEDYNATQPQAAAPLNFTKQP